MRGYFGIGIYNGKAGCNVGTLWRSAYQLGAEFIFTVGHRYGKQPGDTVGAEKHIPLYQFDRLDQLVIPKGSQLVGVEMEGKPLGTFTHPKRAIYLLGAEDWGLPEEALAKCEQVVSIPSVRTASFNVSVAGSLVMYSRLEQSMSKIVSIKGAA